MRPEFVVDNLGKAFCDAAKSRISRGGPCRRAGARSKASIECSRRQRRKPVRARTLPAWIGGYPGSTDRLASIYMSIGTEVKRLPDGWVNNRRVRPIPEEKRTCVPPRSTRHGLAAGDTSGHLNGTCYPLHRGHRCRPASGPTIRGTLTQPLPSRPIPQWHFRMPGTAGGGVCPGDESYRASSLANHTAA